MNVDPALARTTLFDPERDWALEPGLAALAFGSRVRRRDAGAPSHLAFLSQETLEIDLDDPRQREFGDYELLEQIGQGGMGVVYRARQAGLEREVAVKLLSAGPWASPEFIARFQREAQAAARMQHPNIVAIHETGVHGDLNFFSMQLVHGGSLANQLAACGPMAPIAAAQLLRTVAEAVDYAHRLDVLHLDIKPGNVLIGDNGQPQVADFGLARRIGELISVDRLEVSGTPSYMSPEQVEGRTMDLSPATDIYGLGALLYECLTGKPPFHARTAQETLAEVVNAAPLPPRQLRPGIPVDLEAICLKCLSKRPADRYRSARDLADDLSRFLEAREVLARPLGAGGRMVRLARREPVLTGLAALLVSSLVLGIGATALQWRRAENNAAASSALLWDSRRSEALRLERDGRGFDALPRLLANVREQERADQPGLAALERRRMGLISGQGAVLVDRMVVADASPLALDLSPDGARLAIAFSDQSVRWYDSASLVEHGRVQLHGRVDALGHPAVPRLLRFSGPDRLRVTLDWLSNQANPSDGDSWLVDLARAAIIEPPPAFKDFADATFDAEARFALLRDRHHRQQLWQVDPWRAAGPRSTTGTHEFTPWLLGPRAGYAAFLEVGMAELRIARPASAPLPRALALPQLVGFSAWAGSHDGRWLALGDLEGRVFLLDVRSGERRAMPAPRSREVTWLDFSEDDAWLAVATRDGTAHTYDVATGNALASEQMQHDFPLLRVAISHRQRLLIAAGRGRAALWRLPEQGPRAVPAQRIAAAPVAHAQAADYAVAWSLGSGLFASAGLDGDVRLWRLPLGPTPEAHSAPQVPESSQFDGRHLVDVAWNQVRLVSPDGRHAGGWKTLEQPPGFAELVGGGRTLVLTVGTQLQVLEAATLHPRYAAIPLPATAERLVVSGDGQWAVLTYSVNTGDGVQEALRLVDLAQGRLRGAELRVAGPLRRLALSPDGARVLALGPAQGELSVFAIPSWRLVGQRAQDDTQPMTWADFDRDGNVVLATRAPDPRFGRDQAMVWDPRADRLLWQGDTGPVQPLGVIATRGGVLVAGRDQDRLFAPSGAIHDLPRLAQSDSTAVLATSADGRLVAHAFVREVQLHDADTGEALGAPLPTDSDANDVIVQLAFAPDGTQLLARTLQGHWRHWRIAADTRSAKAMEHAFLQAALPSLAPPGLRLPTAADRRMMRADDPGAWPAPMPRPATALASGHGVAIPRRSPGLPAALVDLTPAYNFDPETVRNRFFNVRGQMRPIPTGRVRIGAVDYDLRGMSQVGNYGLDSAVVDQGRFNPRFCLAVPPARIAAVHLLLLVSTPTPVPAGQPLAKLLVGYQGGGSAEVALRGGFELPGYAGQDEAVPRVLAINTAEVVTGYEDAGLANPRVANPHPDRLVRCLGVASVQSTNPLVLFAMTTEPLNPAGDAAAVIRAPGSRTGNQADPRSAVASIHPPAHRSSSREAP